MEKKVSEFYTSYKISNSFKIFLLILVIIALSFFAYFLAKEGERWSTIAEIIGSAIGGIMLLYWIIRTIGKRARHLSDLSESERLYVDELEQSRITLLAKRYLFSNMNIRGVLGLIIITGYIFKWMFFWIFAGGSIMVIIRNDTFLNKILMLSLAITWCPWIEDLFLKRLNFKTLFIAKLLITGGVFSIGIAISP